MATGGSPGTPYTPVDTSGVTGNAGNYPSGTQSRASVADTGGTGPGGAGTPNPAPPVTQVDTSGTASSNTASTAPTSTALSGTRNTLDGGVGTANPAYRAPGVPSPGSTRDTTRTDIERYTGGNPYAVQNATGTEDSSTIGATGSGTGTSVPAAPAAPTVLGGPRQVVVTWVAVANPANDPVLEYVVENDRGGRDFAPKNATSLAMTTIDPSYTYKYRVAARNKAGLGPFSGLSAAVRAYNPDATDVNKPAGLDPANAVNPVYDLNGTPKGGTGGTNNAPALGAVTPGAGGSKTVTVNWTAPTVGTAPTGYTVRASDGSSFASAGGTTSKACVFAAAGASVTFTVQATNATGAGAVSAPSSAVTVP